MISLQEVSVRLQEDGVVASRAKICTMAVDVVKQIGSCYQQMANSTVTRQLSTPAITERPSGMVNIVMVETSPTDKLMELVKYGEDAYQAGSASMIVPPSLYIISDGVICFSSLLCGKEVLITYRTLSIADDGWPMVHDALIEPIVLKLYNELVRSTMVRSALRSKPTNNMIIATKAEVNREYHRLISQARATISEDNEGLNQNYRRE